MDAMQVIGRDREIFLQADPQMKAMVFPFEEMEYYEGIILYRGVLEKLEIHMDIEDVGFVVRMYKVIIMLTKYLYK